MRIGALRHFANPAPHILSIDLTIYLQYSAGLVNLNLTYAVRFQYESTTNRISKIFRQVITPLTYFSISLPGTVRIQDLIIAHFSAY